jgi:hypothetical protein
MSPISKMLYFVAREVNNEADRMSTSNLSLYGKNQLLDVNEASEYIYTYISVIDHCRSKCPTFSSVIQLH